MNTVRDCQQFLPRDAMHPRYYSHGPVSVCPSLRPFVTSRSSTKTAKRRMIHTTPYDNPGTVVFWCQRSPRNSTGVEFRPVFNYYLKRHLHCKETLFNFTPHVIHHALRGRRMQVGWVKIGDIDKYPAISRKR